ncbi:MAG: hypothetical protein K5769_06085 [Pseudobutyrivibrio sp.]|nr:hypothetical protein [Pseudobutyrivibrio sp.]
MAKTKDRIKKFFKPFKKLKKVFSNSSSKQINATGQQNQNGVRDNDSYISSNSSSLIDTEHVFNNTLGIDNSIKSIDRSPSIDNEQMFNNMFDFLNSGMPKKVGESSYNYFEEVGVEQERQDVNLVTSSEISSQIDYERSFENMLNTLHAEDPHDIRGISTSNMQGNGAEQMEQYQYLDNSSSVSSYSLYFSDDESWGELEVPQVTKDTKSFYTTDNYKDLNELNKKYEPKATNSNHESIHINPELDNNEINTMSQNAAGPSTLNKVPKRK